MSASTQTPLALAPVEPTAFRAAAGQFPSGVTVVATRRDGETIAKTVSAFSSLSLDPPLIGAAIGADTPLARTLEAGGGLGVSVLRETQRAVSDWFATAAHRRRGAPPAAFVPSARDDAPVLEVCQAWFGCRVVDLVPAGDHVVVVGHVLAVRAAAGGAPLLHHGGRYRAVAPVPSPESP